MARSAYGIRKRANSTTYKTHTHAVSRRLVLLSRCGYSSKKEKVNRARPCARREVLAHLNRPRAQQRHSPHPNTRTQHHNKQKALASHLRLSIIVCNYCSQSGNCCNSSILPTNLDEEAKGLHDVTGRCAAEHPAQPSPRHLQLLDEQHSRPMVLALRHFNRVFASFLRRLQAHGGGEDKWPVNDKTRQTNHESEAAGDTS